MKNNSYLFGKVIRVTWSHRDPNARKSNRGNMLVKNLTESIDKMGLYDLFEKYGNILSSKVIVYDDGKSEGCNFFQFELEEVANSANEKLATSSAPIRRSVRAQARPLRHNQREEVTVILTVRCDYDLA